MKDSFEDILPESSTQLVSLNTRIPRKLSEQIKLSVGILQTTHNVLTFSKQSAVQILLIRGYQSLLADFESGELQRSEHDASKKNLTSSHHTNCEQVSDKLQASCEQGESKAQPSEENVVDLIKKIEAKYEQPSPQYASDPVINLDIYREMANK